MIIYYISTHFILSVQDLTHINRYATTNPATFRVGDIVEAQLSFNVIPLRGEKHKMLMTLRALTLLDHTHSTVSTSSPQHQTKR